MRVRADDRRSFLAGLIFRNFFRKVLFGIWLSWRP